MDADPEGMKQRKVLPRPYYEVDRRCTKEKRAKEKARGKAAEEEAAAATLVEPGMCSPAKYFLIGSIF